jgi:hypothetical protein
VIADRAALAAPASGRGTAEGFPEEGFRLLERSGALRALLPAPGAPARPAEEWALVRRVAAEDGSLGRIVDGHLNGVERVLALAPPALAAAERAALRAGARRIGVWGADPLPDEGSPARLAGDRVHGVKVFCSGAGGVDRALVTVRGEGPAPMLAYLDVTRGVRIDRDWYRGAGLRASESHRVELDGTPVVAVLGRPGELGREPLFSRDAIRTAASWAGIADRAAEEGLAAIRRRGAPDDLAGLAAGRILAAVGTIDAWLERAARAARDPDADLAELSVTLRAEVADACRRICDEAARAAGSRALVDGGALDRCRRDLDIFLLQHRLDPMVARLGRGALERRG